MQGDVVAVAANLRGRVFSMKRFSLMLLAVGALSASSYAFEAKPGNMDTVEPGGNAGAATLGLEDQKLPSASKGKGGFELPGLGSLGVLPKLDFGLELLYGEAPAPIESDDFKARNTDPEDLTIRGTFKHRF